jgi:hypothetical protein
MAAATALSEAMAGFRLAATDISRSTGDGPTVRGPMATLLLVCCGRIAALPKLSGDGAAELTTRLKAQIHRPPPVRRSPP